jgi:hypothetical protein
MADVAIYCVSGLPIKNNSSVSCVIPNGTIHSYQHGFNDVTSNSGLQTRYDPKFDDISYYTN